MNWDAILQQEDKRQEIITTEWTGADWTATVTGYAMSVSGDTEEEVIGLLWRLYTDEIITRVLEMYT